jgi:hypothetical protein
MAGILAVGRVERHRTRRRENAHTEPYSTSTGAGKAAAVITRSHFGDLMGSMMRRLFCLLTSAALLLAQRPGPLPGGVRPPQRLADHPLAPPSPPKT